MLTLIAIMTYMLEQLEYSSTECEEHFTAVQNGEIDLEELLDTLNLQVSPTSLVLAQEKINKWPSALWAAKTRLGLE